MTDTEASSSTIQGLEFLRRPPCTASCPWPEVRSRHSPPGVPTVHDVAAAFAWVTSLG